jgi:superfamily II DNA or RNA helicase
MLLDSRVHILDECHLAACETVQAISHHVKAEHFYGMSASPWRDDGSDMLIESVLGRKVVDISAKYLIERGFLVKPVIRFLAVPPYVGAKKAAYKTVYKNYITVNAARNKMICTAAEKLVEQGFKTLVLFKNKAHGQRLYEMISDKVSCEILNGDDKFEVRKEVCDKLNNGEIDCIIASTIFDIGVDLPSLSALVIGGGGKSSVRALQRVGRVIRKYTGKTVAPVIDFADQAPYLLKHSLMRKEILEKEFEVEWPQENQGQ